MSKTPSEGKIVVEDKEYPFPQRLTIAESLDIERIVIEGGGGQIHMTAAMVWIAMRRVDPGTTWEQVGELDLEDFDVEEPSKNGADAGPPARAPSVKSKRRATSGRRRSANTSGSGPGKSAT